MIRPAVILFTVLMACGWVRANAVTDVVNPLSRLRLFFVQLHLLAENLRRPEASIDFETQQLDALRRQMTSLDANFDLAPIETNARFKAFAKRFITLEDTRILNEVLPKMLAHWLESDKNLRDGFAATQLEFPLKLWNEVRTLLSQRSYMGEYLSSEPSAVNEASMRLKVFRDAQNARRVISLAKFLTTLYPPCATLISRPVYYPGSGGTQAPNRPEW